MNEATETYKYPLKDIPRRIPILDAHSAEKYPSKEMLRQWMLITEVVKREIQLNPEVRRALLPLTTMAVRESLPSVFLSIVERSNPRVQRILKRYNDQIRSYIDLPPVPDELIQPDIRHANILSDPTSENYLSYYSDPENGAAYLEEDIASGIFQFGITREEKNMITQRYKFARDVKILALAAEMLEQNGTIDGGGALTQLSSGTELYLSPESDDENILDPLAWKKRENIKDRVWEIKVGDKRYILKEKKTSRHTDTKKNGHKNGLTSREEFKTAQHFSDIGQMRWEEEGIIASWEKPIGFVNFVDGFQFSVYQLEDNIHTDLSTVTGNLYLAILQHKSQFETEYEEVKRKTAENIAADEQEPDLSYDLSFESFARIKALFWVYMAKNYQEKILLEQGFKVLDDDGYFFRFVAKEKLELEIIGMDFEYYVKMSPEEQQNMIEKIANPKRKEFLLKSKKKMFDKWGAGQGDDTPVTLVERVGYALMLERYDP